MPVLAAERTLPARINQTQQVNYLRAVVSFSDGVAPFLIGTLPANAYILSTSLEVAVAFNATTTLTISTDNPPTAGNSLFNATVVATLSGGVPTAGTIGLGTLLTAGTVDKPVYADLGVVVPTVGRANIVIVYLPDNG